MIVELGRKQPSTPAVGLGAGEAAWGGLGLVWPYSGEMWLVVVDWTAPWRPGGCVP